MTEPPYDRSLVGELQDLHWQCHDMHRRAHLLQLTDPLVKSAQLDDAERSLFRLSAVFKVAEIRARGITKGEHLAYWENEAATR